MNTLPNVRSSGPRGSAAVIKKKKRKIKSNKSLTNTLDVNLKKDIVNVKSSHNPDDNLEKQGLSQSSTELAERFPILKDEELVKKFLNVSMTNNQKGRIRTQLRDQLKDTADLLLPDVIHNRIQAIIKNSNSLTDPELRKIRILYNMLKTAVESEKKAEKLNNKKKEKKLLEKDSAKMNTKDTKLKEKNEIAIKDKKEMINKEKQKILTKGKVANEPNKSDDPIKAIKKVKGPKRYVVFVGNLPVDVTKDMIMNHFWELNENIVSVRIPKREDGAKSSIAYVELGNEPSYELALSKHHSMMGPKRINVLYTTQTKSKITKTEAKSKSAKLIALQKSGKLAGSLPLHKKRSHRRMIAKRAQAKLAAASQ